MTIAVTTPVTGATVTGLTSPTYTIVSDTPPSVNSKAWAITALGGTQTGVDIHSTSKPFTFTVSRPANVRQAPVPNSNGLIGNSPRNVYSAVTRKGGVPVAGQAPQVIIIRTEISVPSGVDTYEPEELKAAVSLHIGALSQQSAGIADTCVNNVL